MTEPAAPIPFSFEEILNASPDAVVLHEPETDRVLYWNAAAEVLYGWKSSEILGRPVTRIFYRDTSARAAALETLRSFGRWDCELRQLDRNGREHWVRVRQQLLRGTDGGELALLSYNTEVTEQKRAADVESRAKCIRSSRLLADGLAHELNNILAPIMLSASMLQRSLEDAKARGMVAMIERSATRGAKVVADLLEFERGKSGDRSDIRRTQVERLLRRAAEETVDKSIDLSLEIADDLWDFPGDVMDLGQVFKALLQNACEAMPEGGRLVVRAENQYCDEQFEAMAPEAKAGAYVRFSFTDTGCGIEAAAIARIAEPFFTTKTTRREGAGFGLTTAQAVVKGHNGYMVVESEPGRGTILRVFLPATRPVGAVEESAAAYGGNEGRGRLVLVVDDEFFIRDALKLTLEDRGYRVLTAENGVEALALYTEHMAEVALVVSDVEMPRMDGIALSQVLKRLNPAVKILISSGRRGIAGNAELKAAEVRHFLVKPYTAEDLGAGVRAALGEE